MCRNAALLCVRNGSSLLGLPQFPSSNVELGAVSVKSRSAAPGGTGRWPAPRPAFLPREAGEASEGPGACLADAGVTTSPRRDAGPCLVSVGRGAQGRTPGVGFQGRRRQEAEAESARAGVSAFPRGLCFRMACGRTVVPSAYGTTFVPLAWPHRCTAHPPWEPPAVGAPASAQFLFLHSKPGGATAASMQRAHGRWLRELQTSLFKPRCFVVPSSKKCLNPSVSNCHRDGLHWRRAGSCTCLPFG